MPLTLDEAQAWLARGNDVSILIEAIVENTQPVDPARQRHDVRRGARRRSGHLDIVVIAILAGTAIGTCPNLGDGGVCRIYDQRPLVCRIYPMEINPFVPFRPESKGCPAEAWDDVSGTVVMEADGRLTDPVRRTVEASRAADRADAADKIAICERLGLTVTGWRGNGFAIFTPNKDDLLAAIFGVRARPIPPQEWTIQIHGASLERELRERGARLHDGRDGRHTFHPYGPGSG